MRHRNEALHAEVERMVDLKIQMISAKVIAARHKTTPATVRVLISRALKERKANGCEQSIEAASCDDHASLDEK